MKERIWSYTYDMCRTKPIISMDNLSYGDILTGLKKISPMQAAQIQPHAGLENAEQFVLHHAW